MHRNARGYFKYFLENNYSLKISTISIAEYCVLGDITDLPLRNLQILPFNLGHATKTGRFAKIIFEENKVASEKLQPRAIIPNDSKLFAQADLDESITHFVTSDERSRNTFSKLRNQTTVRFEMLIIQNPYHEVFGLLDLE